MSFTPHQALVPDRDSLPLKKRDQRPSPPPPPQQSGCESATFKAPYPYRSHSEFKTKHTGPFQPIPRRVPALYQPWTQTQAPITTKPHLLSAFREHHGRNEWRDFNPLHPRWDFYPHFQPHTQLPSTPAFTPHQPSRYSLLTDGLQRVGRGYGWEQLRTIRDKSLQTERLSNGRAKGPYPRRRDRNVASFSGSLTLSKQLRQSPPKDLSLQRDTSHKSKAVQHPGHSFMSVSPDRNSTNTSASIKRDASRSMCPEQASSSSSSISPNKFPWLLPHFVAGSLIELGDGRLRRVEHLQTEDFLLGSLACPDLCLSCCTVQSISPSTSSSSSSSYPSISRLLILLHNQKSQELVDVYVEYPFFVRDQGWSSCSPQRTARLCGLQCRQLSVGDVYLALTPVSASKPPQSVNLEPKPFPRQAQGRCESLKASQTQVPPEAGRPLERRRTEVRRRHYSAPELIGQRTNS